jgi:hypothetical protein
MKFLIKVIVVACLMVGTGMYTFLASQPITKSNKHLTPQQVATAKQTLSNLLKQLSKNEPTLSLTLQQIEIDVLSDLAAHTIKKAGFETYISQHAMTTAVSYPMDIFGYSRYINAYCAFAPVQKQFSIDHCRIGKLPVSHAISEWLFFKLLKTSLSTEANDMVVSLFRQIQLQDQSITLVADRPNKLKKVLIKSVQGMSEKGKGLPFTPVVNPSTLIFYLELLKKLEVPNQPLAYYIGQTFKAVEHRTKQGNAAVLENRHALWALSAYFGNSKFSKLIGVPELRQYKASQTPALKGRADLTLHFLYSVILDQVSGGMIGLSIGEMKELHDANTGGSGYSFADLAADKAGLKFSQFLTRNEQSARTAQLLLANTTQESIYFPSIGNLPEGLSGEAYEKIVENLNSNKYKNLTALIDQRIAQLPLYNH